MKCKKVRRLMTTMALGGGVAVMGILPSAHAAAEAVASLPQEVMAPGEESPYPILRDANGNVYDLGGMEIVIRDWWTDPEAAPAGGEYAYAQEYWREWIQETYNFKIVQKQISSWGDVPQDFVDYVSTGGDNNNYVFVLRDDELITSSLYQGFMYDLATLDCLDFKSEKLSVNKVGEKFSFGNHIYAMYPGEGEPGCGVFFNKRLLKEVGISPDEIYDMQKNGTWTWDKMVEIMDKVQRDTDGDGKNDIFGANCNNGALIQTAVFSNGGEFVGKDANGRYVYRLEDENTTEGLAFAQKLFDNYWETPDGAWDQYKQSFIDGIYAFMFEETWAGQQNGFVTLDMQDDWGYVMFPKGPKATDYTSSITYNTPYVIPACYDADRAWKIAFAWNLYTDTVPGHEGKDDRWQHGYLTFDQRAVNETIAMMRTKGRNENSILIQGLTKTDLLWNIGPTGYENEYSDYKDYKDVVASVSNSWKAAIDATNKKIDALIGKPEVVDGTMYRLYNPNSGEHFYTARPAERDYLVSVGWNDEGLAWKAPETSNTPVYRLYNPNAGDHHYTTSAGERDFLVSVGWNDEGIGWYSDDAQGEPLYRLYNPNATTGAHHYTTNAAERDYLVSIGWNDEGIGWYGMK